ncbi:divergent polysaccharide deacetylase family protein [Sporomusa aerivorans]|uniref:divergent polysaccharide deacetylase family protein n=1 Tax=Sporomusa aerivorans TaxID=204936 RepID=UPI00352AE092
MAKKTGSLKWWLLLGIAIIGLIYYYNGKSPGKAKPAPEPGYNLEKTGAGVVADYSQASLKIHNAVDAVLANAKLAVKEPKESKREVPRKEVEGLIRWHSRQMLIELPDVMSPQSLEKMLIQAEVKLLGTEPDTYAGQSVVRFDIGLQEKLGGEPLTLVTDRLYIAVKGKPAEKRKSKGEGSRGEMAIVIDDFGYNREPIAGFAEMGRPITFAVLPYRTYSNEAAAKALSAGHLVMLHLPLEPLSASEGVEPTVITTGMSDEEIRQTVTNAIAAVPGVKGVNNHQGSKATADRRVMKTVLGVIKSQSLFFIDSRTSSQSVAAETARQMGIRTGENELFLDNSPDIGLIKNQLRKAVDLAGRYGSVIVIGHSRPNTVVAVREMIPEIEAAGIRLVYANQLVK